MKSPGSFKRRVLLCVSGMTPQVITETLYGLLQSTPAFVPTEIHVLTTSEGAKRAHDALVENPRIQQLFKDYGHGDALPLFGQAQIHVPKGGDGQPLGDIRTAQDNAAMADAILELATELTEDEDCAVHASIAGGRKTMSYYLGYVMGMVGREQDRLSHVLINAPFEFHSEFFYPTKQPRMLKTQTGEIDASQAQVTLAAIPFVALNARLQKSFVKGLRKNGELFSQAVNAVQLSMEQPRLLIDLNVPDAFVGRKEPVALNLAAASLTLYTAAAILRKRSGGAHDQSLLFGSEMPWHALSEIRNHGELGLRNTSESTDAITQYLRQRNPIGEKQYYENHANRIKNALDAVSPFAAQVYGFSGPRNGHKGLLGLAPEQIEIRWPQGNALNIDKLDFNK